jgi:hypothetical protein
MGIATLGVAVVVAFIIGPANALITPDDIKASFQLTEIDYSAAKEHADLFEKTVRVAFITLKQQKSIALAATVQRDYKAKLMGTTDDDEAWAEIFTKVSGIETREELAESFEWLRVNIPTALMIVKGRVGQDSIVETKQLIGM